MNPSSIDVEDERGFTGNIDQSIRLAQKKIAAGEMVDGYEAYIQELQKVKAQQPNYAEGEPPGLSAEVYERIYHLKQMLREVKSKTPELEAFEININAVLEAYRTGGLEIKPGMVSYWVDGVQISPLVPRDLKHTVEIAEEHHGRAFWEEKPSVETILTSH